MSQKIRLNDKEFESFIQKEEIDNKLNELAQAINKVYKDKHPLILCILNGSFIFAADLVRKLDFPLHIEFVRYASYKGTSSTGEVKKIVGLRTRIKGRDILIVEDIIDTGLTLTKALEDLVVQQPNSVKIATLLFKPDCLKHDLNIDYIGFEIPDDFVVGYGLDYDELGRDLPDIYKLSS